MKSLMRTLLVVAVLGACSDDAAVPPDLGGDSAAPVDALNDAPAREAASRDGTGDKQIPTSDGPQAEWGADKGVKDSGQGTCGTWAQWTCVQPGAKTCSATCSSSGTPLQLECNDKGGAADCECKKSGVKTSCGYSGPTPTTCDNCKAAFLSGCCVPP